MKRTHAVSVYKHFIQEVFEIMKEVDIGQFKHRLNDY